MVAQKVVSKAEGPHRCARTVSRRAPRAIEIGRETNKDPRLVELILSETKRIVRSGTGRADRRASPGLRHGQCRRRPIQRRRAGRHRARAAAAGRSRRQRGSACAPPWRRAFRCRASASSSTTASAVPWRLGTSAWHLGVAGLPALEGPARPARPISGGRCRVSISAFADEIAAAASLLMGQGDEGRPMVLVRGLTGTSPRARVGALAAVDRRRTCSGERRVTIGNAGRVSRCPAASAAPSLRSGLSRVLPPEALHGCRQHRRRLRASGPVDLAGHRYADVHAGWPRQSGRPAGAAGTRPGPSCARWRRLAARPGSSLATRTWPCMWSARGVCAAGESLSQITADLCQRLGVASAHPADVG